MKRKIYTLLLSIAGCLLTSSCSDWFDVSPSTDVPAEELFETESGFQSALAGIYIGMTNQKAYGDNLSFGMLDQMAQLYDMIPSGASDGRPSINMKMKPTKATIPKPVWLILGHKPIK